MKLQTSNQYPEFFVKPTLRFLGLPWGTRWEQAQPVLRDRLAAAHRSGDEERAKMFSRIKAFLKRNLKRTCNAPGCDVAIMPKSAYCQMHSVAYYAIAMFMLCCFTAFAGQVKVAWTASPTPGVTYLLTVVSGSSTLANPIIGTNLTAALNLPVGQHRVFVQAVKDGIKSDPSNELLIEVPQPPTELRVTTP
jgi:hypothetical protein